MQLLMAKKHSRHLFNNYWYEKSSFIRIIQQIDTDLLRFTLVCCCICIEVSSLFVFVLKSLNKHNISIPDLLKGSELNRPKLYHIILHILYTS